MTMHRSFDRGRLGRRTALSAAAVCAALLLIVSVTGCTSAGDHTNRTEPAPSGPELESSVGTALDAAPAVAAAAVDEGRDGDRTHDDEGAELEHEDLAGRWGIEVTSIRLTANNHMIDFRYRVLDAAKAKELFVRQNKPALIHQTSGKVLAVPETAKVGPLRNSDTPKEGKIYWMFFGNGGYLVKAGDKVTVVIGEFRAENLTVE